MRLTILFILGLIACNQPPVRPTFGQGALTDSSSDQTEETKPAPKEKESQKGETKTETPSKGNSGETKTPGEKPSTTTPPTTDTGGKETKTEPAKPKPVLELQNGIYTIQNQASKKCLEITSADKATAIVQFGCNGSGIQAFRIESLGKTEYKITNIETKKSFGIQASSKDNGASLEQGDYANGENQSFLIDYDASSDSLVSIRPKHSQKFLEVPDSSLKSRTVIKQNSESKKDAQRWILTKISEPSKPSGVRYTFVNECDHDVWVGSQNNPGYPVVKGDFKLAPGAYNHTDTLDKWEGRFWGRYNCKIENGKFSCDSGQCAKGEICGDVYGEPPVAIAEFRTKGYLDIDFYDISLVDGTNLPMDIRPMPLTLKADGGKDSCKHLECKADLRLDCPTELQKKNSAGKVIGCKSACEAFHTDEYCCLGAFRAPNCKPTKYSEFFDKRCPDAYSFAEDVKTFTCRNADYEVIFCPK